MCFFFSFVPAVFFAVIGYFVLLSSMKAEGGVKRLGQVLAIGIFVIAAFFPLMGLYITVAGLCPMGDMMQMMPSGMSDLPHQKYPT